MALRNDHFAMLLYPMHSESDLGHFADIGFKELD